MAFDITYSPFALRGDFRFYGSGRLAVLPEGIRLTGLLLNGRRDRVKNAIFTVFLILFLLGLTWYDLLRSTLGTPAYWSILGVLLLVIVGTGIIGMRKHNILLPFDRLQQVARRGRLLLLTVIGEDGGAVTIPTYAVSAFLASELEYALTHHRPTEDAITFAIPSEYRILGDPGRLVLDEEGMTFSGIRFMMDCTGSPSFSMLFITSLALGVLVGLFQALLGSFPYAKSIAYMLAFPIVIFGGRFILTHRRGAYPLLYSALAGITQQGPYLLLETNTHAGNPRTIIFRVQDPALTEPLVEALTARMEQHTAG